MSRLRKRDDGAWILPFSGAQIERVTWEGDSYAILHFAGQAEISMALPERVEIAGPVREAAFTDDGVLTIALDDGAVLESRCDPQAENWEVRGPHGLFVVAVAGADEVAVWE
jgi:uncharacterized protein DUF6188